MTVAFTSIRIDEDRMRKKQVDVPFYRFVAITLFLLIVCVSLFAQGDLNQNDEWVYQPTEVRFKIYDLISGERIGFTATQNLGYARKVLEAPKIVKSKDINALILYNKALIQYLQKNYERAIDYFLQVLENNDDDRELKGKLYNVIGNCFLYLDQPEEALKYYEMGLEFVQDYDFEGDRTRLLNNLGIIMELDGDYAHAIDFYVRAKESAQQIHDTRYSTWIIYNLGNVYYYLGNYQKSLDHHKQVLELLREMNSGKETAEALGNLGVLYDEIGEEKKALNFHQRSLGFLEMIGTKMELDYVLCNVAKIHEDLGNIDEALKYYMRAQDVEEELNSQERLVSTINCIGALYLKKGDIDKALKCHDESCCLAVNAHYVSGQIQSLIHIGHDFLKKNEFSTSRTYYTDALELARSSGDQYGELDSYHALFDIDYLTGSYQNSYRYMSQYTELWDRVHSRDIESRIQDLLNRYGIEKKERELSLLKRDQQLKQVAISRNKILSLFLILICGIVLVLIFVIKKRNKEKYQANLELQKYNKKLDVLSKTDALTTLSNRRAIVEKIEYLKIVYERNKRPFTVIIADIDDFKTINDTFGHDAGDHILISLGQLIKDNIRKQDFVGRWGGDELILVLPDTPTKGGIILGEKIRTKVDTRNFYFNQHTLNTSLTIGVAEYKFDMGVNDLIKKADQALYDGKHLGKNRVVNFEDAVNE